MSRQSWRRTGDRWCSASTLYAVAAAALLLCAHSVNAQCSNVAAGDYNSCYALSSQCYYDLNSNHCVLGSPQICQQFATNTAGCTASALNCTISATTGICSPKSLNLSTCGTAYTTESSCLLHGCAWDLWTSLCWDSLAQVNQYNNCSTWAFYDNSGAACNGHLCSYNAGVCSNIGSTSSSNNQNGVVTYTSNVNFVNPQLVTAAPSGGQSVLSLNLQVITPLVISDSNPTWGWLDLGLYNPPTTYGNLPACSNFNSSAAGPAVVNLAAYNTNLTAITAYITNWITTTKSMQWDNSMNGQAAAALLGNQSVSTFISSIAIQQSALVYNVIIPLANYIVICNATGLYSNVTSQGTMYTIPLNYNTQQPNTGVVGAVDFFYATVSTTGTASLSATSPYFTTVTLAAANVAPHNCPVNQSSMYTAYYLTYSGVYDTTQQVGPRSINDIYVTLPQSGTTTNCYNDQPNKFTSIGCNNNTCVYYVDFYSACYTLASDGSTFTSCPSSQGMAASHNFYVDTYSCPLGQPTSSNCVSINASPNTLSPITSTVSIKALPGNTISQSYTVSVGLLPTPTDVNVADINWVAANTVSTNNTQLYSNQTLTVIASFNNVGLNQALDLQIVPSSILFTPVGVLGNAVTYTNATANATVLATAMTYVPKDAQYQSPDSLILPIVSTQRSNGVIGYDGFSVATARLKQLLPANGYLISFTYIILVRGAPSTASRFSAQSHHHHGRVLMQASTPAPDTYTQEQGATQFNITIVQAPDPDFSHYHGAKMYTIFFSVILLSVGWVGLAQEALLYVKPKWLQKSLPHAE